MTHVPGVATEHLQAADHALKTRATQAQSEACDNKKERFYNQYFTSRCAHSTNSPKQSISMCSKDWRGCARVNPSTWRLHVRLNSTLAAVPDLFAHGVVTVVKNKTFQLPYKQVVSAPLQTNSFSTHSNRLFQHPLRFNVPSLRVCNKEQRQVRRGGGTGVCKHGSLDAAIVSNCNA